jgi:hypothetical protein
MEPETQIILSVVAIIGLVVIMALFGYFFGAELKAAVIL